MNIAFFLLAGLALVALWFLFNPVFKYIGGFFEDAVENVKKNTSDGEPDGENERTDE